MMQLIVFFKQLTDQLYLTQKKLEQVHIGLNGFTEISGQKHQETAAIGLFRSQLRTDDTTALDRINARVITIVNLATNRRQHFGALMQKRNAAGVIGAEFALAIDKHQDGAFQFGHAEQMAFELLCQRIDTRQ